jgi:hypothetical protein
VAEKRSVLIEYRLPPDTGMTLESAPERGSDTLSSIPGVNIDRSFGVVTIPALDPVAPTLEFNPFELADEQLAVDRRTGAVRADSVVARAIMDEDEAEQISRQNPNIQVYSDPIIQPCIICPGSPPMGNDATVAALIGRPHLQRARMTGRSVFLAIVDTGVNMRYLRARGRTNPFNAARSWVPRPGLTPGNLPVDHGTMCAFDATIAAPDATLLDIALLQSTRPGGTVMEGLLSDAVLAYRHLLNVMLAPRRPGELRSMVVNNSWGMFHSSWDFPVGHPGNYSHNAAHPFNRIVASLANAGADIFFAAGNCGRDCPDGRCQGVTVNSLVGANSSPYVHSVAGVDVTKVRVGYSTSGPGALFRLKPDIAAYTHFDGSGVYAADGGTSAACPVAAGVVAAFRSKFHFNPLNPLTSPKAVKILVNKTAEDRGAMGFDYDYGYGIISGKRLAAVPTLSSLQPAEISAVAPEEVAAYEAEQAANIRIAAGIEDDVAEAPPETSVQAKAG